MDIAPLFELIFFGRDLVSSEKDETGRAVRSHFFEKSKKNAFLKKSSTAIAHAKPHYK